MTGTVYVILFNTANIIFLAAFMAKKIIWLRLLTITGMMVGIPYYLYIHEAPMWNNIFWVCILCFNQLGDALCYLPRK